jgi:hypothetical protein
MTENGNGAAPAEVAMSLLEELAAEVPQPPAPPAGKSNGTAVSAPTGRGGHRLKVEDWLRDRGVQFRMKVGTDGKGRTVYVLATCPFDPSHGDDSCVMQAGDGAMSAKCFHNSCAGRGWKQFKDKIGPPDAHHYEPPMRPKGRAGETTAAAADDGRPVIIITTEEHVVNEKAVAALGSDLSIYQRAGQLVHIVRDDSPAARGVRRPFAPRIEALPAALLRERLAATANWVQEKEVKGFPVLVPAHPPGWAVSAVHARGNWPAVRHLEAVVDYPVLRPDGTILSRPGYDPTAGLLLMPVADLPAVPENPTRDDAVAAREALLEVVADFPFECNLHRAAWLAGLLTPLARFAFAGPSPLFLADANVPAAGKGLLLDCTSRIVTGERFTIATYTADEDELRKRITSLVLAGDRLVLFDNLAGKFGNAVLDAALTGTGWKDRMLGVNRMVEGPLYMTWFATGNNVAIAADTARRTCHIRLESPEEKPELRRDFKQPHLLAWVGENRARLLGAALTILRAFCLAGRPDMGLPAWGSFEGWSALVRSAVVWVGLPDPGETRQGLRDQADMVSESMCLLLACWEQMDPQRHGLTAADVIRRLFEHPPEHLNDEVWLQEKEWRNDMRSAVETLIGKPDARLLSYKLRDYRRRIFDGRYLDRAGEKDHSARWAVYPAESFADRADPDEADHVPDVPHPPSWPFAKTGDAGDAGDVSPRDKSGPRRARPKTLEPKNRSR